ARLRALQQTVSSVNQPSQVVRVQETFVVALVVSCELLLQCLAVVQGVECVFEVIRTVRVRGEVSHGAKLIEREHLGLLLEKETVWEVVAVGRKVAEESHDIRRRHLLSQAVQDAFHVHFEAHERQRQALVADPSSHF
ncbi:unnamed protein product, partial [Ectocarpus sp. 8 AP-2014]